MTPNRLRPLEPGPEPEAPLHVRPLGRELLETHLDTARAIDARVRRALGDAYSHEDWGEAEFLADRPEKWVLSAAALRAGRLVGFVVASRDGTAAHVHRVAVEPAEQGGGVGRRLMERSEAAARERGLARATLSVASRNDAAIRFYRRCGYRRMGWAERDRYADKRGLEAASDGVRVQNVDYALFTKEL